MELTKLPNESDFQYHKRLIQGKLVDKTLDYDYAELSKYVYGQEFSSDFTRRMMYGSLKTLECLDAERQTQTQDNALTELDQKRIELQKEKQKLSDMRKSYNAIVRGRARQEELNEIIKEAVAAKEPIVVGQKHEPHSGYGTDLLVSLNDIHYGAFSVNAWNVYSSEVFVNMIRDYLTQIINIADRHKCENVYVWMNGDAIAGNIHKTIAITNRENVIEQIVGVSEVISWFLTELSTVFKNVYYLSVAGNHSRIDKEKDALKDERLDDLIGWYLEARLQNLDNVRINAGEKIDTTMYKVKIRGKTYVGVHGDYDDSPTKLAALKTMADDDVYAILLGHKHHNKTDVLNGVKIIMAGSFLGMDDFCITRRIYGKPEQLVSVVSEDGIVCNYDIQLSDNDV